MWDGQPLTSCEKGNLSRHVRRATSHVMWDHWDGQPLTSCEKGKLESIVKPFQAKLFFGLQFKLRVEIFYGVGQYDKQKWKS